MQQLGDSSRQTKSFAVGKRNLPSRSCNLPRRFTRTSVAPSYFSRMRSPENKMHIIYWDFIIKDLVWNIECNRQNSFIFVIHSLPIRRCYEAVNRINYKNRGLRHTYTLNKAYHVQSFSWRCITLGQLFCFCYLPPFYLDLSCRHVFQLSFTFKLKFFYVKDPDIFMHTCFRGD